MHNLLDLTGNTTVITGGCGLLGSAFAATLRDQGAEVILLDLADAQPAEVAARMSSSRPGPPVSGFDCDVASERDVDTAFDAIQRDFGGVDILINNAATKSSDLRDFFTPAERFDPAVWREVMAVNLDGLFRVAQAAGRQMIAVGRGSIVQIGSIYGTIAPNPTIYEGSEFAGERIETPPVYSASKAGVAGLTRYLAAYWARYGIRVNTVSPGGVLSEQNEEFQKRYSDRAPMGRMASPEEIARAVAFLASPAASYITGHDLIVDGGLSIW